MAKIKICTLFFLGPFYLCLSQDDFNNQIGESQKKFIQSYFEAERYKMLEDYNQALVFYEKCISINPDESSPYNELAKIYFYFKEWDQSEYYVKQAISFDAENIWYYYLLIDIYIIQNDLESQLDTYSTLINISPDTYLYYLQKIKLLKDLKRYKKAIKFINKTKLKFGETTDLLIELKDIFLYQNNRDSAIEIAQRLIEKHPHTPSFYNILASVYMHFSDYENAIVAHTKLLQINPNNPSSTLALYKIYSNKKDIKNQEYYLLKIATNTDINLDTKKEIFYELLLQNNYAIFTSFKTIIKKCLQLYPSDHLFSLILGDIYAKEKQYEEAIQYYKAALHSAIIKDQYIYNKLIEIYFQQNNFEDIIDIANKALDRFPFSPEFYYYKALALLNEDKHNLCLESLLKGKDLVVDNDPLLSDFYSIIGDCYHYLENNKSSDDAYTESLKYNNQNIFVLNNYSYYLSQRRENLPLAKEMIEECIQLTLETPNASFIDTYAWVLYQLKEYNLAKEQIQKALLLNTNSAVIIEHYGDIIYKLGDKKGAVVQWERAYQLDKTNLILKEKINTQIPNE